MYSFPQTTIDFLGQQLDAFILEKMEELNTRSVSACIVKGGKVVWQMHKVLQSQTNNQSFSIDQSRLGKGVFLIKINITIYVQNLYSNKGSHYQSIASI